MPEANGAPELMLFALEQVALDGQGFRELAEVRSGLERRLDEIEAEARKRMSTSGERGRLVKAKLLLQEGGRSRNIAHLS